MPQSGDADGSGLRDGEEVGAAECRDSAGISDGMEDIVDGEASRDGVWVRGCGVGGDEVADFGAESGDFTFEFEGFSEADEVGGACDGIEPECGFLPGVGGESLLHVADVPQAVVFVIFQADDIGWAGSSIGCHVFVDSSLRSTACTILSASWSGWLISADTEERVRMRMVSAISLWLIWNAC